MNISTLVMENDVYRGTRGVSENSDPGFKAAFLDKLTGDIELARQKDGSPAPFHLISWLPNKWATGYNNDGSIKELKHSIISGFESNGVFYTRDEVAEL